MSTPRIRASLPVLAALFAACGPEATTPAPGPAPVAQTIAPIRIAGPATLSCKGNEPFWSLSLGGAGAELQWLTDAVMTERFTGAWSRPDRWQGQGADGSSRIAFDLAPQTCLDSMNDEVPPAPYSITLTLPDGTPGPGCCR